MSSKGQSPFLPLPFPPHRSRSHPRVRRQALASLLAPARTCRTSQLYSVQGLPARLPLTQGCPDPMGS